MILFLSMKEVSIIKSYTFWDWLAWIAFAYVVLYFTLKVLGILHSPQILDILTIASIAYYFGKYAQKIDRVVDDVEDLKYVLEEHVRSKNAHR